MDSLFFILISLSLSSSLASDLSSKEFVYPNFTTYHNLNFADPSGTFLFSSNGRFKAAMFNPGTQKIRFYLCVIHVDSNAIIWSANRDSPVSEFGRLTLTSTGITISHDANGTQVWSTPRFESPVYAMQLADSGNLVLLDRSNASLWESFRYPTDTIVTEQVLNLSSVLSSAVSSDDLSTGDYELALTSSDITLSWKDRVYWKMSMEAKAYVNSNHGVEFLAVNQTGLYLFGQNGSAVVISMNLPTSDFRIATIDESGRFVVSSFPGARQRNDFARPVDQCRVPSICGKLGLCKSGLSMDTLGCSCPSEFQISSNNSTICLPSDGSYSLPVPCNSTNDNNSLNLNSNVSYLQLDNNVDYFAIEFDQPVKFGVNLSYCQDMCSQDCACLGIFYTNSSGSCYKIDNELGSVISGTKTGNNKRVGFVKTIVRAPPANIGGHNDKNGESFPGAKVILPLVAVLFIFAIGFLLWRRIRLANVDDRKTNVDMEDTGYTSLEDLTFSIPGLPSRFSYEELVTATQDFMTQIGTGGYGTVYKGVLSDKTDVAVKRMTKFGPQGKRDFCTEIGVIGNIHHVNLVKLKGYCAQRNEWLLVYEYMNRGSLDKTLFGNGPVLEWRERVEIAIGAAHGLAYLHSGCEPKIIHCDVKPENILLGDHLQAKISDFGLSKFLGLEESSLIATMRGTRGYLAPEWLTRSTISDKTDVYSFGMVLLEIVSGRKNCISSSADGIIFFPLYALEMHKHGRYLELVDPKVRDRATNEDVGKLVRVALCCVHQEPELRPSMVNVVGMLEGEMPLGEPRIESLGFLKFYGLRGSEGRPGIEESEVIDETWSDAAEFSNSSSTKSVMFNSIGFDHVSSEQISGPR